jgi:hypothetical protein
VGRVQGLAMLYTYIYQFFLQKKLNLALLKLTTFTNQLLFIMKTYLIAAASASMKSFSEAGLRAGMKFNLNEDGSKYAVWLGTKFGFRSSQMNQEL